MCFSNYVHTLTLSFFQFPNLEATFFVILTVSPTVLEALEDNLQKTSSEHINYNVANASQTYTYRRGKPTTRIAVLLLTHRQETRQTLSPTNYVSTYLLELLVYSATNSQYSLSSNIPMHCSTIVKFDCGSVGPCKQPPRPSKS